MYCIKCGKETENNEKICNDCNNKINNKESAKSSSKSALIIVLTILAIVLLAGIILFYVSSKNKGEYENFEENLETSAQNYVSMNDFLKNQEEGSIIISDLKDANLLIDDLFNKCEGYVNIKNNDSNLEYKAYIDCGSYKTDGYDSKYSKSSIFNDGYNSSHSNSASASISKCADYVNSVSEENIKEEYEYSYTYEYVESDNNTYSNTYKAKLTLYSNNVVYNEHSDGFSFEKTYGKYEINGNKLKVTYTFNLDEANYGISCREYKTPYSTEEFTIDSDGNLLTDTEYFGSVKGIYPIKLTKVK